MKNTIFSQFLKELVVKYTTSFSDELYSTHAYRDSLYGLSHMLNTYNIRNEGVRSQNKEVKFFQPPFIAHVGEEFVVVKAILNDGIIYDWRNVEIKNTFDNFKEVWSGVALLAEPDEKSVEPEYKRHIKDALMRKLQAVLLWVIPFIIVLGTWWVNRNIIGIEGTVLAIINLIGVYVSYLLLLKQEKVQSEYADKICSLFHQKDCNNILELPAARIGFFSWSEIGFGYFISNLLLIILFPNFIFYQALINLFALPYTFWSVWYQYKKVGQWCTLCLIIQLLLWSIFLVNILGGVFRVVSLEITPIICIGCLYIFCILIINTLTHMVARNRRLEIVEQGFSALRNSDVVFRALLNARPHYETQEFSQIIFGNPKANLKVTILTNPHCEPCGRMHKRVKKLLEKAGDKIYVQYIFSAFSDDLLDSNRFLIAAYLHGKRDSVDEIYDEWYENGKYHSKDIFEKYIFSSEGVEAELQKHEQWKLNTQLAATPTILVNGFLLPPQYNIESLSFFLDINV